MSLQEPLILASTSRYRRELLERLKIPFASHPPDIDETALPRETPEELVKRLSIAKAKKIANTHPQAWVIGSDQVADFRGAAIGKPLTHENAMAQLQLMRGEVVIFRTGLCLMNVSRKMTHFMSVDTKVQFRDLPDDVLESYLLTEQPYDCAGSAKSEGLGISLLSSIESTDPTALIGLPLIALSGLLRDSGFIIPAPN